jgi:hypothetical protein
MQRENEPSQIGLPLWALIGLTGGVCVSVTAQSHYPIGLEGLMGGSWEEPGFHVRDYNYFYYTDRFNDAAGHSLFPDFEAFNYTNGLRPIWIANFGILGAKYGCDVLLPFVYTDVRAGHHEDDTFGLADIFVEPVSLSWRLNHFDAMVAYGFWAPTGEPFWGDTSPGLSQWTHMFSAGGVWYPRPERDWSLSLLTRYEINTEAEDFNVTPGDTFSLEWGLGHSFTRNWAAGVAGYYQRQITGSTGEDASPALPTVAGIGPELGYRAGDGRFAVSLRYAYEFLAEERSQGHLAMLTLSLKF